MHNGRAKIWAWTASISLHMIALAFLAAAEFSPPAIDKSQLVPTARVEQVRRLVESPLKIPRPKVKHNRSSQARAIRDMTFNPKQLFDAVTLVQDKFIPDDIATGEQSPLWAEPVMPVGSVEFFSSKTKSRRVCFVVDCSGSMKGLFGRVKKELINSIESLQQDQYFSIIFFGGDGLLEFENAGLVRASRNTKSRAVAFIKSIEPQGKTNAIEAFKRLSSIRDSLDQRPLVVFFLTDGFELAERDNGEFLQFILELLQRRLPRTSVNTIGFWPDENDCHLLQEIAAQTGGQFIQIGGKED